jgi:methylase of polypeptide subunit release factors
MTSVVGPGPRSVGVERPDTVRFGPLSIEYDERVIRPRPWTARQSHWAAALLAVAPPGPVLELCAGAGHIGLLAVVGSQRRLVSVDVDPVACHYARRNAAAAGLTDRVEVREGDLREAVGADERFALVIADPPYLPSAETARYPEDPLGAIDGGADGMELVWPCVDVIAAHLLPGGSGVLQLRSAEQVTKVADHLAVQGDLALLEYRTQGRGVLARLGRR